IGEVFEAQTTVPLVHRSTPDTATQYSSLEGNMEQQGYCNPQGREGLSPGRFTENKGLSPGRG
ncbi:unnamed protein product, partial [Staurois parvus]